MRAVLPKALPDVFAPGGRASIGGAVDCLPFLVARSTKFQPQTLRTTVGVGVQNQVLRTADRAVAQQTPSNCFFGTACPVVEHLRHVRRELDGHHLVLQEATSSSCAGRSLTTVLVIRINDRAGVFTAYQIYSESSRGNPSRPCGGEGRRGPYPRGFRGSVSLRGAGRQ
jgi:hypothetical protein